MWSSWFLIVTFAAVAIADIISFGKPFVQLTADYTSGNQILELYTTLQLPSTPNMPSGFMVLWPGLYTNRDLVQSISATYSEEFLGTSGCRGSIDQWCIFAYTLEGTGTIIVSPQEQAVNGNTAIDISYIYDEITDNVTQTVQVNGNIISTLSTS
jgi:hypothetical protein